MKKRTTLILAVLMAQFIVAQDFNASMAEIMKNMKDYTIEMVNLMPEEKFDYKPTDSVRTFREQVQHMIGTNHFLLNYYLKGNEESSRKEDFQKAFSYAGKMRKSELNQLLEEQFDQSISFFNNASAEHYGRTFIFGTLDEPVVKDYYTACMLVRDHITHHRAQLIAYLRQNSIKPIQFRGF